MSNIGTGLCTTYNETVVVYDTEGGDCVTDNQTEEICYTVGGVYL